MDRFAHPSGLIGIFANSSTTPRQRQSEASRGAVGRAAAGTRDTKAAGTDGAVIG